MSAIAIKNIIYRSRPSKTNNLLLYTFQDRVNLYLQYIPYLYDNIYLFSDKYNNRLINFCKPFYLFSYKGILTDYIDQDILNLSISYSMPIYCLAQYKLLPIYMDMLNQYSHIKIITHPQFNTINGNSQIIQIPLYHSNFPADQPIDKYNKILIMAYNLNMSHLQQITEELAKQNIPYDIQKELPLSAEFLYKKINMYRYCLDLGNLSCLEYLICHRSQTQYIHNNRHIYDSELSANFIDTNTNNNLIEQISDIYHSGYVANRINHDMYSLEYINQLHDSLQI